MKIEYIAKTFTKTHMQIIETANSILNEYEAMGLKMTLRQLFYQFVARDLIENKKSKYNLIGRVMTAARDAGLISWKQLEDPTRKVEAKYLNESSLETVSGLEVFMSYDYWVKQNTYVELWVEKQALLSIVKRAADKFKVPVMACRGYMSSTAAWEAGQRFRKHRDDGEEMHLIHLGDHDPSGCHMTADNKGRLERYDAMGVKVHRIGLNMDQIEKYNPPPNDAKLKDPRAPEYIAKYGNISWELDALDPKVLDDLITSNINNLIPDHNLWVETLNEETEAKQQFIDLPDKWHDIEKFLNNQDFLNSCLDFKDEIISDYELNGDDE